ncbi:MAG: glucoamylase family protein, partial [Candidatus Eiseniibacteriota bacterium]
MAPDNVQEVPEERVAHRTSPTNIGMGLLSTLAAYDLGYLRAAGLADRLEATLDTVESLERHEGHILNWYDTLSLTPMPPRYVSTVDSGNLAAALMALAAGLRKLATARGLEDEDRLCAGVADTAGVLGESLAALSHRAHAAAPQRQHVARALRELRALRPALTGTDPAHERMAKARQVAASLGAALDALVAAVPAEPEAEEIAVWGLSLRDMLAPPDTGDDQDPILRARLRALALRCDALVDPMNWKFLYDRERGIFSVGYRLADAEGPGRLDNSYYDLLASEARLASFIAIARGDVPQEHWFRLSRALVSVEGRTTLVSWSGSMFEYLMPLLVLRSHPDTLLDNTVRAVVRAQIRHGRRQHVTWGISESAFHLVDQHGNYQYKAFGVPGLGLKRGLAEDLVISPYATALATLVDPASAAANFRRLAREGASRRYGFYEALDYTPRKVYAADGEPATGGPRMQPVRAFFAHHQGMSLVALANAVLGSPMVQRFHSDPRVQATEPLLQERVPRFVPITQPRPPESTRVEAPAVAVSPRRFRSPHTPYPVAHFLSNGQYTAVVTNAGGGASSWRGRAVTRQREDPTCDPGSQFIYLRDVRSGQLWSAAYQPLCREPERYRVSFRADEAVFQRGDDGIETQLEIAVSPEDDVEVRRVSLANHSDRLREIEVTSLVEVVLAPHGDDLAHPAFLKLFLETEYRPECSALLCGRRPRSPDEPAPWA